MSYGVDLKQEAWTCERLHYNRRIRWVGLREVPGPKVGNVDEIPLINQEKADLQNAIQAATCLTQNSLKVDKCSLGLGQEFVTDHLP